MRLQWGLLLPTVIAVASALVAQKRDASFYSVRTKMNKDLSGRKGDSSGKYFHESVFHPHYDGRFADRQLGYQDRKQALSNLIQTYLATLSDLGVETWLMHGTLLGWWWNRKILPWDSDSDVQMSESSMHYLASYYNMSVFHYKTPRIPEGRDYLLEINPHYLNREQSDRMNVIDARWIDTNSGLFIDITTARYNLTHPAGKGMLSCKDGHEYRDTYIFPLRDTYFEGAPAKIPFAYKELLESEYRQKALTMTEFEGHHFDEDKLEWLPIKKQVDPPKPEEKKPEPLKVSEKKPETKSDSSKQENKPAPPKQAENIPAIAKQDASIPAIARQDASIPAPTKQEVKKAEVPPVPDLELQPPGPAAEQVKLTPTPPQQPAAQKRYEEKLFKAAEKRAAAVKKLEDKRYAAETKEIAKGEKRMEQARIAQEKAAAKKLKEEATGVAVESGASSSYTTIG